MSNVELVIQTKFKIKSGKKWIKKGVERISPLLWYLSEVPDIRHRVLFQLSLATAHILTEEAERNVMFVQVMF